MSDTTTLSTPAQPLPTRHGLNFRIAEFDTLAAALDYAAQADTGLTFFDGKGSVQRRLSYQELRQLAIEQAQRLLAWGLQRQDRVALIAESEPDFVVNFFACQYAGLIPIPAPITIHLGGRESFVFALQRLVHSAKARICLGTDQYSSFINEAQFTIDFAGSYRDFFEQTQQRGFLPSTKPLVPNRPGEIAYVQFTSGSTRQPRGAVMTQSAVIANIQGMLRHGVVLSEEDRFCTWLPLYHDMGLVGMFLSPLCGQSSIDLLDSRVFAMRPRLWPNLIARYGSTISYSPPFGYELCARRIRGEEAARLDLSRWRIAGVGAEMVRPEILRRFAAAMAPARFNANAFLPCYGMAEVGLGVSFSPINQPLATDTVLRDRCANEGFAEPAPSGSLTREFTKCGIPIPQLRVEIRDASGAVLGERQVGSVFLQGPCVMSGYLDDPAASAEVLRDGWLDTGDLGYQVDNQLVITGRRKDLVIINGRNIWPQDLELIAENEGVRTGSAAAFAIEDEEAERVVLVIECKSLEADWVEGVSKNIRTRVRGEFGIDCTIVAVTAKSLPRTSSGKLSRAGAQKLFLQGALSGTESGTDSGTDSGTEPQEQSADSNTN